MTSPLVLKLETSTWERDSHGLFDYESTTHIRRTFTADNNDLLIRHSDDCMLASQLKSTDSVKSGNLLLEVIKDTGQDYPDKFLITPPSGEALWVIVKELKSTSGKRGYILNKGDVIKLGRVRVKVKEISLPNESASLNDDQQEEENSQSDKSVVCGSACRICLSESSQVSNPLVSVCKCAGTMKLIHIDCLKHWLQSKVATKHVNSTVSYYWKTPQCELCKEPLSSIVRVNDRDFDMLDVHKPDAPYIVLEDMRRDQHHERCLHVTTLVDSNPVFLGRSHESDIRISDISVSRRHALVRMENSQCILEDYRSKFGTLIRMKRPLVVDTSTRIACKDYAVQIGRSMICATVDSVKPKIMLGCFSFGCCKRPHTEVMPRY